MRNCVSLAPIVSVVVANIVMGQFFFFWDTNENRLYLDVKTKVPEFDPQAYERLKNTFIMLDSCTNAGQQGQATALGAADVLGGTG